MAGGRGAINRIAVALGCWGLCLVLLGGCRLFVLQEGSDSQGYWMPLAVTLQLDPTVTNATLNYRDSCQQPQMLPTGEPLSYFLIREVGMAFEQVRVDPAALKQSPDGAVEVALKLNEITMFIPSQTDKSYEATVSFEGTVTFRDRSGNELYAKSLRTDVRRSVSASRQGCDVNGLTDLVSDASLTFAQGVKKYLGTSVALQDYAKQRSGRDPDKRPF
ncbi:MAG: hypothetical protein ACREI9_13635 [Nitrospiraceae bacterium]